MSQGDGRLGEPTLESLARDAIARRDAGALRRLLEGHPELRTAVNAPVFSFDAPALVVCASDPDPAMIDVLLEFGADPNRRSDWWAGGFHPLHSASGPVAERLLAAGAIPDPCAAAHLDRSDLLTSMLAADPSRVHERGGDGQTPLHFARSSQVVDLLLAAGADPDARDVDHRATPAQWMLDRRRGAGRYDLARYVVERGGAADIFLAAALGLTEPVEQMLRENPALLDLRTSQGDYGEQPPSSCHIYTWTIGPNVSPLQVAAQFDQPATREAMQNLASPRQRFLAACELGDRSGARALLGGSPRLMEELRPEDHGMLADAGWAARTAVVALMLELGFDPLAQGQAGGTVLHGAAWEGSVPCVAAILAHGSTGGLLHSRDPAYGATPLGWCCHGSEHCGNPEADHAAVAGMLLQAGARPGADTQGGSDAVRAVIENWSRPA